MPTRDLLGKRGEAIATARLMDFCGNPEPYFDVHPLGEKCPTFDYLVELVNAGDSVPYFLAQVKSTQQGFTKHRRRLLVQVDADDTRSSPMSVTEHAREVMIDKRARALTLMLLTRREDLLVEEVKDDIGLDFIVRFHTKGKNGLRE